MLFLGILGKRVAGQVQVQIGSNSFLTRGIALGQVYQRGQIRDLVLVQYEGAYFGLLRQRREVLYLVMAQVQG